MNQRQDASAVSSDLRSRYLYRHVWRALLARTRTEREPLLFALHSNRTSCTAAHRDLPLIREHGLLSSLSPDARWPGIDAHPCPIAPRNRQLMQHLAAAGQLGSQPVPPARGACKLASSRFHRSQRKIGAGRLVGQLVWPQMREIGTLGRWYKGPALLHIHLA